MDATTLPEPADAPLPTTVRSMGATLGALLGMSAMVVLYVAAAIPAVEAVLRVHYILGPDGMTSSGAVRILAWAVAPVAAAAAGWIAAQRAFVGRRLAGAWMGYLTYGLAMVIAPLVVFGPDIIGPDPYDGGRQPLETLSTLVTMVPVATIFASVVLAPLLLACVVAGTVWAAALRWVMRGAPDPGPRPSIPETDTRLLLVIGAMLGILWLLAAVVVLGLSFGTGDLVD